MAASWSRKDSGSSHRKKRGSAGRGVSTIARSVSGGRDVIDQCVAGANTYMYKYVLTWGSYGFGFGSKSPPCRIGRDKGGHPRFFTLAKMRRPGRIRPGRVVTSREILLPNPLASLRGGGPMGPPLRELLLGRGLGTGLRRRQILARRYVGRVGHARDLSARGIVDADAGVIEQITHGAVEFDARFLVGGHGRHQGRLRCG